MTSSTVFHGLRLDDADHGRGLWLRKFAGQEEPVLTNLRVAGSPRTKGKRGSALINIATGLLMILAIALYVVSISAQWRYVMEVKDNNLISWIEAASLDGGMAVFTLLALGLSRAGQAARIERLMIVICALGSAAMNEQAAGSASLRDVLAYTVPPLFLASVVDRTVSVIRRHYLGDDDASAWSQLGKIALYTARLVVAPVSTLAGGRRALLAAAPVPPKVEPAKAAEPPLTLRALPWPPVTGPAEPVKAIETKPTADSSAVRKPRPARTSKPASKAKAKGGGKQADLIRLATEEHGLAELPLTDVSRLATRLAPEVNLHAATARRVLVAHARSLQNGEGQ